VVRQRPVTPTPGREIDSDTGLMYHRARWFDPVQARFLSEDPIGFLGNDINLYGYVWRNPLNYRDALGLDGWGNDVADSLDAQIESLRQRWQYCDQEWVANGINNSVADVAFGFADLFRVGSGLGHAIYSEDENNYGRAAFVVQDIARASAIFQLLAGPATKFTPSIANELPAIETSPNTLVPGRYATESMPARGTQPVFNTAERAEMNRIGRTSGSHSCGAKDPGTKSGNFIPDHQPVTRLNPAGSQQNLFPHCIHCSRLQGGQVRSITRGGP